VSVEELVMQTMRQPYEDNTFFDPSASSSSSSPNLLPSCAYQHLCGGWVGWHCEGSILRSLFTLLMWGGLYDCVVFDVFQTPYQDAPLDLYGEEGQFYFNR
jgi:hypothetical protein